MYELFVFTTGGALPAAIVVQLIFTVDKLRISNSKSETARSLRAEKKLGVTNPVVLYGADEMFFNTLVSYNILEAHDLVYSKFINIK